MLWSGMVEKCDYYFCLTKLLGKEKDHVYIKVMKMSQMELLAIFHYSIF